ncbi:DUF2848 family protein [Virgibacillus kekensis]|uniref:DUF2848 family protein n=1 Tax=Virgibacillus kekensis TaxID=202261 RepID=A0ABV9DGG1_9BACI
MEKSAQKHNTFEIELEGGKRELTINKAYCIGYTGRNKEKTFEHIKELAEIGVPEPAEVPALYPVSVSTLNQAGEIEVIGDKTSGEAEIVLIFGDTTEEVFLSVGSDHTDRGLETVDINKSKQVCDKPFAGKAWDIKNVIEHWDELELASEIKIDGIWIDYQKNPISSIITLDEIKGYLEKKDIPLKNSIVFSGTVPLLDGFKYGEEFRMTLTDPVKGNSITSTYNITRIAG